MKRSAKTSQQCTQVWEKRIRLLPGWKRIFRLAVGCWPGLDGHLLSSRFAAIRAPPTCCGVWDCDREREEILRRDEAAQRLQSRDGFGVVMSMAGWISSARKGVKFLAGLRYAH